MHLNAFVLITAVATTSLRLSTVSALSFFPPPSSTLSTDAAAVIMNNVIAMENEASVTPMGSKDFLLSNPSGAYTTARTCGGGNRIFEWEAHVERTASSLASILEEEAVERNCRLSDPVLLRRRLDASVEEAVRLHKDINNENNNNGVDGPELKITALVGWKKSATTMDGNDVYEDWVACHVTSLPPLPTPPIKVEVRGSPRENASAKNSAWVADRAPLESLMAEAEVAPINELLLINSEDEILEGSQTNFYAIIDGKVHTAQDGILEGTVRRLVLDVCRNEGIPVLLRPPSLKDLESWQGALLSSTSRLALPIDELYIPTEGCPSGKKDLKMTFQTNPNSTAARIQKLVSMEVEARSTPIGNPVPVLV